MNGLHKTQKSITADKKLNDTTLKDLLQQLKSLNYKKQCNIIKELLNDICYKQHKDVTIPLIIRLAIYYTAYTYCKENKITSLSRNVSVQSVVLKDLDMSNNMFTKWTLTPRKDFLLFNSPFQLKLTRAGKKNFGFAYFRACSH